VLTLALCRKVDASSVASGSWMYGYLQSPGQNTSPSELL
jgi:hypothetical protein